MDVIRHRIEAGAQAGGVEIISSYASQANRLDGFCLKSMLASGGP
jgi:hypothetical protein